VRLSCRPQERLEAETQGQRRHRLQRMSANQELRLAAEMDEPRCDRLQRLRANQEQQLAAKTEDERGDRLQHPIACCMRGKSYVLCVFLVCTVFIQLIWSLTLVLGDATILSLNCDISKTRYCNRTLAADTIISRQRLYHINSDNRSTSRLRVEFNLLPIRYVLLTRYMMRTLEFAQRFLWLEFWLRLIAEASTPFFICVNIIYAPVRV